LSGKKREDSYFAAGRRKNRKYMMIIIPVVAALVAVGIAAAVMAPRDPTSSFGMLGSAHEHAVFQVSLEGEPIDFSQSQYQVKSRYIHVENGDGTTLHKHSTSVPVGEFFRSVNMNVENDCFVTDDGSRHCEDGTNQLRYFVNGMERASIMDYVLMENDRILILYGSETEEQTQAAIDALNAVTPKP
jgi:hypothetical protein